jgi:hypothetical protein
MVAGGGWAVGHVMGAEIGEDSERERGGDREEAGRGGASQRGGCFGKDGLEKISRVG